VRLWPASEQRQGVGAQSGHRAQHDVVAVATRDSWSTREYACSPASASRAFAGRFMRSPASRTNGSQSG
jgi:hypothetical protein